MTFYYSYLHKGKQKYKATATDCQLGHKHDSKKEARRCEELHLLVSAGVIKDLEQQPEFVLQDKFIYKGETIRSIKYIADFKYFDNERGLVIVEDVKASSSFQTDIYKLKKKLFLNKLLQENIDIEFLETY